MRLTPWATYLWPGLPQLWLQGAWSGLALALAAAGLLDVLLLSTLVWIEWFEPWMVKLGWLFAAGLWAGSAITAARCRRSGNALGTGTSVEGLFRKAQGEYLQGDYFQAEATLNETLALNERDAEARLLLATLLRHTKRYDEAESQIRQLSRLETAARWHIEITSERARLKRLRKTVRTVATPSQTTVEEPLKATIHLPDTSQAA